MGDAKDVEGLCFEKESSKLPRSQGMPHTVRGPMESGAIIMCKHLKFISVAQIFEIRYSMLDFPRASSQCFVCHERYTTCGCFQAVNCQPRQHG